MIAERSRMYRSRPRRGIALVLVCVMIFLVFIGVVYSVDIARLQLTQLELQSGADLAARAGAEAMARGVGDPNSVAKTDSDIRNEIQMIAELNRAGGQTMQLDLANGITFGRSVTGAGEAPQFQPNASAQVDSQTDSVRVSPALGGFPFVFGAFVGTDSVNLRESAAAMVQERDIVVVLDRSSSMMEFTAGNYKASVYPGNLRQLQEDLYLEGDLLHPDTQDGWAESGWHTEFVESGGVLSLSKAQALKLAVLRFRQEVAQSPGSEMLGLVTYSRVADLPSQAQAAPGPVDIEGGLSSAVYSAMTGNGITTFDEKFASSLEDESSGYRDFDFNYLAMRWSPHTNITAGIEVGVQTLFGPGRRPFATPIVILMTDGQHNQEGTPEGAASAAMAAYPKLRIYTVTFGSDAAISPMQAVATVGRGKHYHANDVNDLVTAFVELATTAGVTLIE